MNRDTMLFSGLICIVFVLLMVFAGQPITPETDLVQHWYDALCNPAANQAPLYLSTWRSDQSDEQLQMIVAAYRAANGYTDGCTAIVNPNISLSA
jgi:hypothetical protein